MRPNFTLKCGLSLFIALLGTFVLWSCAPSQTSAQQAASAASTTITKTTGAHRKLAVLIGINDYPNVYPPLHGALNDVHAMKQILTSRTYGFKEGDVHTLKQEQATRVNILKELDEYLIKTAQDGDVVVFYFSGHGSTLKNRKDPAGYDNTIVPYDSRDEKNTVWDIRDKELNARARALSKLVGPRGNVTFILDSCRSGTGIKAAGTPKSAPADMRFGKNVPPLDLRGFLPGTKDLNGSGYFESDIDYVLIAGSRTDQLSFETADLRHGELTLHLVRELAAPSKVPRTYRDVMNKVIPPVRRSHPDQTPQLEGSNLDQVVFGVDTISTGMYILANPVGKRQVELQGGRILGFTKGSIFDVYDPAAHLFHHPEKPVGSVRLDDIQEFRSIGTLLRSEQQIPMQSKAIEREHNFEAERSRVLIEQASKSKALQEIKARLDRHPQRPFDLVAEGEPFQLRVVDDRGRIRTFGPDGAELSAALPVGATDLTDHMESRMLGWARWFGLLKLSNPASPPLVEFTMIPTGAQQVGRPGQIITYTPGNNCFDLKVKNLTSDTVFVHILDLTSDGRSRLVYPTNGAVAPLNPNQEMPIKGWGVRLPAGATYVRDVFKLITTTNQVDLSHLQTSTPRGKELAKVELRGDPLNRLLVEAALGARDGDRTVVDNWSVSEISYEVCKNLESGRCVAK